MKKLCCICLLFSLTLLPIHANTSADVTLASCTDGDTAHFYIDGKDTKVRFLAINAPEYTKEKEPFGKEASEYVCRKLKEANTITLEYDDGSDKTDKYDRVLAWVYVDGTLLQKELIEQGLAEVKYLYGDYAYTKELQTLEKEAKAQKLGMWSETTKHEEQVPYMMTAIGGVLLILAGVFLTRGRKRKKLIAQGIQILKKK